MGPGLGREVLLRPGHRCADLHVSRPDRQPAVPVPRQLRLPVSDVDAVLGAGERRCALEANSLALLGAGRRAVSALVTERIVEVSPQDADCMALPDLRESRFDGVYKATDGPRVAYLGFGAPIPAEASPAGTR